MARARDGFSSQPESTVMQVRPAVLADSLHARKVRPSAYGAGEWCGVLNCGHRILRHRRPKVGQVVVCWACADGPHKVAR